MNFENIFILPNVIGVRSRRRFGGIFIRIPKVTSAWSSQWAARNLKSRYQLKMFFCLFDAMLT